MTYRSFAIVSALALAAAAASAQAPAKTPVKTWTPARTGDGQPDLQGTWTNATLTPFQRPPELAGKEFFTEQEEAAFEQKRLQQNDVESGGDDGKRGPADLARRAYNGAWFDRGSHGVNTRRTSLVVEPSDGRIPPMTPEGKKKFDEAHASFAAHPADGPENRPLSERCILFPNAGPPMLPEPYNNNYQIVQSPGFVTIMAEMVHDVRVVPLDGRPHLPSDVHQWKGDSRGHWEGNILVIDTTNFAYNDKSRFGVAYDGFTDQNLHVTERFTRTGPATILYRATVDDPSIYTKPWTVETTLSKRAEPIYEYACHEGNYGMFGILSGERVQEKTAAAKAK
jgi:hypothetical protein